MKHPFSKATRCVSLSFLLSLFVLACTQESSKEKFPVEVLDPTLHLDLIASDPVIVTPIGIAFDAEDHLYVLESNTHSPPSNYAGYPFDRIKKGIDENNDGVPDHWVVFADSIINGINLDIDEYGKVYVASKQSVVVYTDADQDGISDHKKVLLTMPTPKYVYDHAGILGIALGPDGWLYVSRGNLGSKAWSIIGADGKSIEGQGLGGVVLRCKTDGTQLELLTIGFWNPFDIKFTMDGRLLLTDNDPDSRGPNRLIEQVPGGDYGFKDLYGGNGLHPYVSWNGELPGTLPMVAALGEAPCALIDASYTNFGETYFGNILVNVWEESNIVHIPMQKSGSTIQGESQVLVQGDSTFHPVGLAANSKGDLFITDWVVREYPNHGRGKIWRLSANDINARPMNMKDAPKVNRFSGNNKTTAELIAILKSGDAFEKTIARHALSAPERIDEVKKLIESDDPQLRLQALLTFLKSESTLEKVIIDKLLMDEDKTVRRMALIYTGTKFRTDLKGSLKNILASGKIDTDLFETYLATVQQLQPEFIENYQLKTGIPADKLKHTLPENYIDQLILDSKIPEAIRAVALPYLEGKQEKYQLLLSLLKKSSNDDFTMGLMKALRLSTNEQVADEMHSIAMEKRITSRLRAQAVLLLTSYAGDFCDDFVAFLSEEDPLLQQASIKYLCRCANDEAIVQKVNNQLSGEIGEGIEASWNLCTGKATSRPENNEEWTATVDNKGDALKGQLVFESTQSLCQSCHQIGGWGGTFGPNLSHIGSSKSTTQLIKAILEPSFEIAPEWQGWYVVDSTGVKHTGRQIDVNGNYTELLNLAGTFDKYMHPKRYGVLDESLMPTGLQHSMTRYDFNNLITYLESLK